jgi:hypothetical protein
MNNADKTKRKLKEQQHLLEELIQRSIEQSKDINDARIALRQIERNS